jgi:predicted ATPase/DNA-binding SARP family transcriptional activator
MFQIYLFGRPEIHDPQGRQRVTLATRKVEQLLAYLWLHRDQPQARDRLAGLFWPGSTEEKAKLSLRQALYDLRKALEVPEDSEQILLLRRITAQFNPQACCWVDVQEFEKQLDHAEDAEPDEHARLLREAVALYRGEFLEGCYDDWCIEERDYLKNLHLKALQELVVHHAERKEYEQAISYAKLLLSVNPLQEEVHRQLMYLHYAMGDRNAAIQQYRECETILKQELDVEPLPETQALFKEIEERASTEKMEMLAARRELIRRYPELGAPFVGREQECEKLIAAWERATQGSGRAVLVAGEAGIGKTRLAQEVIQYAGGQNGLALIGRCYEAEGRLPYQPWIEVFRQAFSQTPSQVLGTLSPLWLGQLMKLVPELIERFPAVKPTASLLAPEQERNRLFEAFAQCLVHLSRQQPLFIFLDDLQWTDESTLHFTHYLLRTLSRERMFLLGVYRVEEVDEEHPLWQMTQHSLKEGLLEVLELTSLSELDVEALVSRMLKVEQGPQALTQRLQESAHGNPFFVVELLKSLIEAGAVYLDDRQTWQIASEKLVSHTLPATVKAVVQTRLRRLSHANRELLDLVSTRTRAFDVDFLEQALGRREEELAENLAELLKAHFVMEEASQYQFRHDILREVIYQGLIAERRRQLHRKAGQALETIQLQRAGHLRNGTTGEIAQHFYQAGEWPKALEYSLLAGKQAWSKSYAKEEAAYFYQRALELAERLRDEQCLMKAYKGLGEVYCFTDKHDEGLEYSLKALELCKDPEERADIYCAVANVYHYKREFENALSYCDKALEELGPKRESLAAVKIYDHASSCLNWLLRYDKAIEYCEHALKILKKNPNDALTALILSTMGHAYSSKGDYEKAAEHLARAAKLAKGTRDFHTIANTSFSLGLAYYNGGHVDQALVAWNESLQASGMIGNPGAIAAIYNRLTQASIREGDIDQALNYAHRQLEHYRESDDPTRIAMAYGVLACLYEAKNFPVDARKLFRQALDSGSREDLVYYNVIVTYLYLGNLDKALEWLERGLPYLKDKQIEHLNSCPAYTPTFNLLRQDQRFQTLIHRKFKPSSE